MDPIWDVLKEACDQNEKRLAELQVLLERLPKKPQTWFYLSADYLCPPELLTETNPNTVTSPSNESHCFISISKVSLPCKLPNEVPSNLHVGHEEEVCGPLSQIVDLKEVLSDHNFPESVKKFISEMQPSDSKSVNESDAVSFCQYLLDSDKYISEVTGVSLFNKILYPVICNPDKMFLSVLLLEKVRELANKFPIFMMNGVVIPVVSRDNLEKERLDIVSDILRGLNEESLNSVLKGFLNAIKRNDDSSVKLLTTIINRKPKLDSELSFTIVTKLHNLSGQYSSNIQFGKMLLEIIPLLNGKITEVSLKILKEVIDRHSTFLKMLALKLFNELVPV